MSKYNLDFLIAAQHERRRKYRSHQLAVMFIAAGLVMLAVLIGCQSRSTQPTQAPAAAGETPALADDGASLLETRCSTCHSADRAKQARKAPEQWAQTVSRMIDHGAQLTDAEKTVLVDYLAATYGP